MWLQFNISRVSIWLTMYEICSCGDEKERSEAYFLMEEWRHIEANSDSVIKLCVLDNLTDELRGVEGWGAKLWACDVAVPIRNDQYCNAPQ